MPSDYKRNLAVQSDSDRKEFLYDASSFANTQGGDLVFGMEEGHGLPINLVGLAGINPDKKILRLEHILRDGIRPPITGVHTVPIGLANGNFVIVMRILKSWNPPHQVIFQKAFRFYARDTNGKYQVDVDELRSAFSLSGAVAERIRTFRAERAAKIAAIFASLLNVKGVRLLQDINRRGFPEDMPFAVVADGQLHFVETICAKQLRVTLDHLSNAAGLSSSPYFDANGDYTLKI